MNSPRHDTWALVLAPVLLFLTACVYTPPSDSPESMPAVLPTAMPTSIPAITAAQVVRVIDGDTVWVEIDGQIFDVRYIGMDTPETVHRQVGVECYGPEASQRNRELVESQTVYLEKDVSETDRYSRLLRYVSLSDGRMVNEVLVAEGFAEAKTYPPDTKYEDRFSEAETAAKAAKKGMWGECAEPGPPPSDVLEPTLGARGGASRGNPRRCGTGSRFGWRGGCAGP